MIVFFSLIFLTDTQEKKVPRFALSRSVASPSSSKLKFPFWCQLLFERIVQLSGAFTDACKHIPECSIEWRFSFFITNFLSNHNCFIKILFSPVIMINPRPIETIFQDCGSMSLLCVCHSFAFWLLARRYSSALEYSPTDVKTCLKSWRSSLPLCVCYRFPCWSQVISDNAL